MLKINATTKLPPLFNELCLKFLKSFIKMAAVCLKAKSSAKSEGWSSIFTSFNTDAKSCIFIKQLTSTCISTILHLRKVLSDDYFEERNFEGITLKLLKSRKGETYVTKIEQWLEGAFEAIERKYLKRLMLDIQDAQSSMTLEIYTMTFNYSKKSEGISYPSLATDRESEFTPSKTEENTIKLLQMCYAVTQTYNSLPSQVKLSMRLSYYENTPEDYQPKGYMAWEPMVPDFPKQARCVEIGVTGTQHHFFKLINKSCLNDKFFESLNKLENSNSSLPQEDKNKHSTQERQTKAKRELCFDKCNEDTFVISEKLATIPDKKKIIKNEVLDGKIKKNLKTTKKEVNTSGQEEAKNLGVRCSCLSSEKTERMILCLGCKFLVHAECYGILHFDVTRKIRFHCHLCHDTENFKCHDKVLVSLKNSYDQQKLSVLRKLLRYCTTANTITFYRMEKTAGVNCPKNILIVVLNKMIEIGVVLHQKRRKNYLINKSELEKNLMNYFYKVQHPDQSQNQTFPYRLRNLDNCQGKHNLQLHFNKQSKDPTAAQGLKSESQTSQQSSNFFL